VVAHNYLRANKKTWHFSDDSGHYLQWKQTLFNAIQAVIVFCPSQVAETGHVMKYREGDELASPDSAAKAHWHLTGVSKLGN
jgi:hypothetical protein